MYSCVRINTAPAYDVHIGEGLLKNCGKLMRSAGLEGKAVIVSDSNVAPLYLERVISSMKSEGYECCSFIFPAGEKSKNLATLGDILDAFAAFSLTRKDFAVALGGGVTGDITGFAAGCYMRGIDYVQLPTTLLAAVDSSVGGKTAIDLKSGKNLAGLFIQPKTVICDCETLLTLPDDTLYEGASEAIKTGIIGDIELFEIFENGNWRERLGEIISRSVAVKGHIVSLDEREGGIRKLLNLGHTPAHAIELLSGYKIAHGAAVGMGMGIMARAAAKLGILAPEDAKRIVNTLGLCGLDDNSPFSPAEFAAAALGDKKRQGSNIDLVLPERIGSCRTVCTQVGELENIFKAGMETL